MYGVTATLVVRSDLYLIDIWPIYLLKSLLILRLDYPTYTETILVPWIIDIK
jgi:hypothetical protein